MFSNFAWSEMLVIACVAIIVVGPKDLPGMLRTFGKTLGSIKRLAGDFQRQFNDAIKESELDELKDLTSTSGFEPLQDAKKSMEEMAKSIQDPTKSVPPPNKVSQLDGPSGNVTTESTKSSAKPAAKTKASAKTKPAAKTAAKRKTAAAMPRATTKTATTKKPAANRAASKKTATASKTRATKAKSAS